MILAETMPDVLVAEAGADRDVRPVDADAAAARTREDYGRLTRWLLGLLGTFGALIATVVVSMAAWVLTEPGDPMTAVTVAAVLVLALALGIPSIWLLLSLHRSGRRLARAAGYWAGLPYRSGRRRPTGGDWFAVRFLSFSPDLFLRVTTSALAALATTFFAALAVRALVIGAPGWELVLWAGGALLFAAVCAGQFGGVQRIQNGHLAREPRRQPR
ncbi:hypothetical protein ACFQRL_07045 [Microbacterium fluvii]|uniref:Uncharacterized protein n=1 Tax=Microbacterium fluvii TaxID=415215 RepID=A0ABW2HC59_9MICO|nr:hypothetical protein [Microbacterium fluvii]MCU4672343.1 hypothetical protein [Microbacterium fluvii]